jgi:hypothetical protein
MASDETLGRPEPIPPELSPLPQFDSGESSCGHVFPLPIAMRDILEAPESPRGEVPIYDLNATNPEQIEGDTLESDATDDSIDEFQPRSRSWMPFVAVVGVLGIGVAAWTFLGTGGETSPSTHGESTPTDGPVDVAVASDAEPGSAIPQPASSIGEQVARANDRIQMQAIEFDERHALLMSIEAAGRATEIDRDLHVALDLVQAETSSDPCRTFAGALLLVERAPDKTPFSAALDSIDEPPRDASGAVCVEQAQRLAALKGAPPEAVAPSDSEATPPVPTPTKSRRTRVRSKKRDRVADPPDEDDSSTKPVRPDPSQPETPTPTPTPTTKVERSRNVASALDDGLRPMGN